MVAEFNTTSFGWYPKDRTFSAFCSDLGFGVLTHWPNEFLLVSERTGNTLRFVKDFVDKDDEGDTRSVEYASVDLDLRAILYND